MDKLMSSAKSPVFKAFLLVLALYFLSTLSSYASYRGCCSSHGGVSGCGANNTVMCKDGTQSPSCKCNQGGTMKTKNTNATAPTMTTIPTMTTPASKPASKRGCCKGHGGVASCDPSGYLMCKDKTLSSTCRCP